MIGSLGAIAVIGTLSWMQNMMTAPIGIGWMYFAMLTSLALIVPFGLIFFNLIATLFGGAIRNRAPLLFAAGAVSMISIGLAAEISHSLVGSAWELKNTTDATGATHFALVGGAVFGGFAGLYYWFPKMTGRTMGESLGRISFWTMVLGTLLTFVPLMLAGSEKGEVVDAYKFFDSTGVNGYNLIASIGAFILAIGIIVTLANAIVSRNSGAEAGHDPWGADSLEWFTLSPPEPHNFDVLPDVRSAPSDARHPRRDCPQHGARRAPRGSRVAAGSLSGMSSPDRGDRETSARRRGSSRLPDADQAEGPVIAVADHGDDDVRRRRPLDRARLPDLPRRRPLGRRRRRHQPRRRPRHRPPDGAHRGPPGGRWADLAAGCDRLRRLARRPPPSCSSR